MAGDGAGVVAVAGVMHSGNGDGTPLPENKEEAEAQGLQYAKVPYFTTLHCWF